MDLFSLFKEFYGVAIVNKYPANVRGVYDSILYDFNARFFPEHCIYTQRELSDLTGLSLEPLHRALKFLAERGHIKVKASKKGTVIRLPNTSQTQAKHKPNTSQTQGEADGLVSYTAQAHASNTNNNNLKTEKPEEEEEERASAQDIKDAKDLWVKEIGRPILAGDLRDLGALYAQYGRESLLIALTKARRATGNNFGINYLQKVLEDQNKPKTTSKKGGERNDKSPEYEQPDTSKDPDLSKYL